MRQTQRVITWFTVCAATCAVAGCDPHASRTDGAPPTAGAATTGPAETPGTPGGGGDETEPESGGDGARKPAPPECPWAVSIRAADDAPGEVLGRWTGGNRLEVRTREVPRLRLDLTRLPRGAPRQGPWNLQIDGQGFEITGRRGKVLELERSKAGLWAVVGP